MTQKQSKSLIDFWSLKHQIDDEIARLGWSKRHCTAYIVKRYGKISRLVMTDDQLIDLLEALRILPFKQNTTRLLRNRKKQD